MLPYCERFQSTRPRGARRGACCFGRRGARRFNPRAHAGRDQRGRAVCPRQRPVSIHAPTRGATRVRFVEWRPHHVSIHAPTRGATIRAVCGYEAKTRFNPRAHAGRDLDVIREPVQDRCVSIHAPTRGATLGTDAGEQLIMFQSTRPRGARLPWSSSFSTFAQFQSTRPRGARRSDPLQHKCPHLVSIHAPTRGATRRVAGVGLWEREFQSTRPRGARPHLL